jgi:hypothetical protein
MLKTLFESWNKYLLLELDYGEISAKLDGDKFVNSCNYHGVDPEKTKNKLLSTVPPDISDPDKANYLNWRLKKFMTTGNADGPKATDVETFYQIKSQNLDSRFLPKNDINRIDSVEEFTAMMEPASAEYESYNAKKAAKSTKGGELKLPSGIDFKVSDGAKLVGETNDWYVFIPETKGAAQAIGIHTKWCTAAPGLNYYESYHKPEKGDPLIDFVSKNEKYTKKDVVISTKEEIKVDKLGRKRKIKKEIKGDVTLPVRYQFSFGSRQFMDVDDRGITTTKIFAKLIEILLLFKDKLPEYVNKKVEEENNFKPYEVLPNGRYIIRTRPTSSTGNKTIITYYNKNDQIDREEGPAITKLDTDGKVASEQWYTNGINTKDGSPSSITYLNGVKTSEKWTDADGKPHAVGHPAIHDYHYKGWFRHGVYFREDGPAIEFLRGGYYGKVYERVYYIPYNHRNYSLGSERASLREYVEWLEKHGFPIPSYEAEQVKLLDLKKQKEREKAKERANQKKQEKLVQSQPVQQPTQQQPEGFMFDFGGR